MCGCINFKCIHAKCIEWWWALETSKGTTCNTFFVSNFPIYHPIYAYDCIISLTVTVNSITSFFFKQIPGSMDTKASNTITVIRFIFRCDPIQNIKSLRESKAPIWPCLTARLFYAQVSLQLPMLFGLRVRFSWDFVVDVNFLSNDNEELYAYAQYS